VSNRELFVLIAGSEAGHVVLDRKGTLRFEYADAWRRRDDALHLSLSMPLARTEHAHAVVHPFLWGLLPDNEVVMERWARRFQVSASNAFALLAHVGEDCAGAVQFVRPERLDAVQASAPPAVEWLTEADVAGRLRALREDQGAWRSPRDRGQFSLAGTQPKTALFLEDGRFGVPAGRTPTTHILKPPMRDRPGHVENEHLCLTLAREVGLAAAASHVQRFGDELAIVVARYDRLEVAGDDARRASREPSVLRLHQEDMCQAMAVHPGAKYQSEGGPAPGRIAMLLREHSTRPEEDVAAFFDALAFSWLTAGTDAHAKNYSLLHSAGGRVRLAPLYDLATALLYPGMDPERLRLAMKIGSKYRLRDIVRRHWVDCSNELGLDAQQALSRMERMVEEISGRLATIGPRLVEEGLDRTVVARLVDVLTRQVSRCRTALVGHGA
jgi:serine/threonine-protein kinase HipA